MTRRDFIERDIHLALDGELPEDERAAYAAWLEANPEMKARAARYAADMALIRGAVGGIVDEPVPEALSGIVTGERPASPPARAAWWRNLAAAVMLVALGGTAGYLLGLAGADAPSLAKEEDRLADHAIGAYVTYAVDQSHAVEVDGGDRDYLQRWLSKRTGLKLVVPDLAEQGFELVGGRLLSTDGAATAALLVYKDKTDNQVSIYMTAEAKAKAKGTYETAAGGPTAIYWLDDGFGCAIVSAVSKDRLDAVAGNAWRQIKQGMAS